MGWLSALPVVGDVLNFIGQKQTNDVNQGIANQANQTTLQNNQQQLQLAQQNMAMQEEFAKNGISWRIADAARNGIAPLAALGASEPGYSPVNYVPGGPTSIPEQTSPLSAAAAGFPEMSQNLSRALSATRTPEQKASDALDVAYKAKQNDLLDLQIQAARTKLNMIGSPGINMAWTTVMNRDGTTSVVPTEEAARASHGESFGPLMWSIHNGLIPSAEDFGRDVKATWSYPDVRGSRFFGEPGNYYSTGGAR